MDIARHCAHDCACARAWVVRGPALQNCVARKPCSACVGYPIIYHLSQVSAPPLAGGYMVGDKVFFTGKTQTFESGDMALYGGSEGMPTPTPTPSTTPTPTPTATPAPNNPIQ